MVLATKMSYIGLSSEVVVIFIRFSNAADAGVMQASATLSVSNMCFPFFRLLTIVIFCVPPGGKLV